MSRLTESCPTCQWRFEKAFQYHGDVPVEHPICPSCGGELVWQYAFESAEIALEPDEMAAHITTDEAGFPLDESPTVKALGELLDARLEETAGVAVRVSNVAGVVDVELRPYANHREGVFGAKVIANVGRSFYSMALLELLGRLNAQLPMGAVIAHTSTYGLPIGSVELFSFGEEVGLYFQHVIPREALESGEWEESHKACKAIAASLSRRLRQAASMLRGPLPFRVISGGPEPEMGPDTDELVPSDYGSMRLEEVGETFLDDLLLAEPSPDELVGRIEGFLEALDLETTWAAPGVFNFKQDSARVRVSVINRAGRTLVRYSSNLLTGVDLGHFDSGAKDLPARALTALNDQIIAGRCLIEPETGAGDEGPYQIVFEKTLLGADLDMSEFALTLAMVAEEADRMDNLLQETFGGLRADEVEASTESATDLHPLLQKLAARGLPDTKKIGVDKARMRVLHLLEEIHLPVHQDEHDDFWFSHGSARLEARVWQDERATYITLRARVLRDVDRTEGLAEALNAINNQIHVGAFVFKDGRHVDLVETLLADDLSIEEFAYALVSVGELADNQDDDLKAVFGGQMGED